MANSIQVTTTLDSREAAEALGSALVEGRFAACAQIIGPTRSIYRWKGTIEHAEEWLCVFKTTRARFAELEAEIRKRHSYELPEIIATPIDGSAAYLEWISREVSPDRRP